MSDVAGGSLQRVWSPYVRLSHWALVAMVAYTWIDDSGGKLHRWIGYAALALVLLRIAVGLLARPGATRLYLPGLQGLRAHVREMRTGRVARVGGHNPLGMSMSLFIWLQVVALGLSGWICRWDLFWGEDLPRDIHAWLSISLQVCVGLHLLGIAVTSLLERQNLALAMLSGRKRVEAGAPDTSHEARR